MKICLTIIISIAFTGCGTYLNVRYGVGRPREVTPETLKSFLHKNHFPADNQYFIADSACYGQLMRDPVFRKNLFSHLIFNREGSLLQRDTSQCQWAGGDVISQLVPDTGSNGSGSFRLDKIMDRIVPLGAGEVVQMNADPDFTLVVVWAEFLGKYNYRLFDLEKAVRRNSTARIRLIWLNVDMMKSWQLSGSQKMTFRK